MVYPQHLAVIYNSFLHWAILIKIHQCVCSNRSSLFYHSWACHCGLEPFITLLKDIGVSVCIWACTHVCLWHLIFFYIFLITAHTGDPFTRYGYSVHLTVLSGYFLFYCWVWRLCLRYKSVTRNVFCDYCLPTVAVFSCVSIFNNVTHRA